MLYQLIGSECIFVSRSSLNFSARNQLEICSLYKLKIRKVFWFRLGVWVISKLYKTAEKRCIISRGAEMAFQINATFVSPDTITKSGGPHVLLFISLMSNPLSI